MICKKSIIFLIYVFISFYFLNAYNINQVILLANNVFKNIFIVYTAVIYNVIHLHILMILFIIFYKVFSIFHVYFSIFTTVIIYFFCCAKLILICLNSEKFLHIDNAN